MPCYFDYTVTFTIPEGRWAGWKQTIDIEFMTADEITQQLSMQLHESGALQQIQYDDGTDDWHDFELDEDMVDELFTVTGDSDWEELGYDVDAGLDDLLGYRDDIVRVIAGDDDPDEVLGIWKALVKLSGSEYVDCDSLRDNYIGRYDSMKDYAMEFVGSMGDLLPIVRDNIDWDGVADDLEAHLNYDENSGHLFRA
jgi:hypothetical protein